MGEKVITMGDKVERKCPDGQYWTQLVDGIWDCVPDISAQEIDDSYSWCSPHDGLGWHRDKDGFPYCVPCQTIKYTYPAASSVSHEKKICPDQDNPNGTKKTRAQAYAEADAELAKIIKAGCQVITPGYFFDRQIEILKTSNDQKTKGISERPTKRNPELKPQEKAEALPFKKP